MSDYKQETKQTYPDWEPTGIKPFGFCSKPKFLLEAITDHVTKPTMTTGQGFHLCCSIPEANPRVSLSQNHAYWSFD
ncbi:MAG: hypothetical protein HC936_03665 [Leptolyngbyaceae cyanobacterium SU_3_3]|nr:hypothetical protein [Leptolyngbyaceae cyanobacterium SU_3_3]NJR54619.1 hypothetical protein [Acaryochloris sp. CRU_2_0]